MAAAETTAEEWVQLIVGYADELKAAGVSKLRHGVCEAEFQRNVTVMLPADGESVMEGEPEPDTSDPLNDPNTYPGGVVPRFNRTPPDEGN